MGGCGPTLTAWLTPQLAELGPVRRRLRHWLDGRRLGAEVLDDVVLIMSELATNAVRAAHDRVQVQVGHSDGNITVEVRDDGPGLPPATAARFEARMPACDRGRGLFLVDALSDEVSVTSDGSGTLVHARRRAAVSPMTPAGAASDPGSNAAPGRPASG